MPDNGDQRDIDEEGRELEKMMDREESRLASALRQIAVDYRKAFKRKIRDNPAADAKSIHRHLARLRDQYRPRIDRAIEEAVATMREKAREITIEQNPDLAEVVDRRNLPSVDLRSNADFESSLQLVVDDLARELLNRMEGRATESHAQNERTTDADGDQQRSEIERPADSTVDDVAGRTTSSATTEGRDDVAKEAQNQSEDTLYATRTSVLDENTCDPCADKDGERYEVGSDAYQRNAPPAYCEGGERCRCYYTYSTESQAGSGGDTKNAAIHIRGPLVENATHEVGDGEWHLLYTWGRKEHPQGAYEVDREFAEQMVASFKALKHAHGYHPPILRQHQTDGYTYGEVAGLRVTDRGIEGHLVWSDGAKEAVENGLIDRLSPTHAESWEDPETGDTHEKVLIEASFVSREHLKSLPTIAEERGEADQPAPLRHDMEETVTVQSTDVENDAEGDGFEADGQESPADTDDTTENMPAPKVPSFAMALDKTIEKATTADGMPGPSRSEHVESIAAEADMSAQSLASKVEEGSIVYPSDDLLEAVAGWLDVDPADLRSGQVEGFGPSGAGDAETPDPDTDSDAGQEMDGPASENIEDEDTAENAAAQLRRALEEERENVARLRCEAMDLSDPVTDTLVQLYRNHGADAYERALSVAESSGGATEQSDVDTGDSPGGQIGTERGAPGTSPDQAGQLYDAVRETLEEDDPVSNSAFWRGLQRRGYTQAQLGDEGARRAAEIRDDLQEG